MKAPHVQFYHLTHNSAKHVLPSLLQKALTHKMPSLVKCRDEAALNEIDEWLWCYQAESFLPHAKAGTAKENSLQPILLSHMSIAVEGYDASLLFILDESPIAVDAPYQKIFLLFDGNQPASLTHARRQWKGLNEAGLPLTYWQQSEGGGWIAKAKANQEEEPQS